MQGGRAVSENNTGHGVRVQIPGMTISDLERIAILETLKSVGGSTSKAAKILGISPRKIQYKLHEYGRAGEGETGA